MGSCGRRVCFVLHLLVQASDVVLSAFEKEFEQLRQLRHANVLLVMARVANELSFVTEYCERGSLHEVLHGKHSDVKAAADKHGSEAKPVLPPDRAWQILLQLASALDFLHSLTPPVVHRDIKSANCLLTAAWTLKLTDFGLAKTQYTAGLPSLYSRCVLFVFHDCGLCLQAVRSPRKASARSISWRQSNGKVLRPARVFQRKPTFTASVVL